MSDPRTLLQRLHGPAGQGPEGRDAALRALAESVRDNLSDLLGTRQGSVASDPEYGLPDFNSILADLEKPIADINQHGVERLKDRIAKAVGRYEPRFKIQRVRAFPDPTDPFTLRFELAGRLLYEGRPAMPFRMQAAMVDQHLTVV